MIKITVDTSSFNNLNKVIQNQIILPRLQNMTIDTKQSISSLSKRFTGTSQTSISSLQATTTPVKSINKRRLTSTIEPVADKLNIFKANLEGSANPRLVDVTKDSDLEQWVSQKYGGNDKLAILSGRKLLRIKSKFENNDPLGSPRRNFFGLAFEQLIRNKNKYNLI